jgi:hypothetical protein
MHVSFIDSILDLRVFQCSTAGVDVYIKTTKGERRMGRTTDHSDRFYLMQANHTLVRVKPVCLDPKGGIWTTSVVEEVAV